MLSPCVSVPSVRLLCSKGSLGSARTSRSWLIMTNYDCFSQISLCSFTPLLWLLSDCSFLQGLLFESLRSTFVSPVETMVLLFQCPRHLASDSLLLLWTLTKIETVSSTWLPLSWSSVGVTPSFCSYGHWQSELSALCPVVTSTFGGLCSRWTVLGESRPGCHELTKTQFLSFWVTRQIS